jgi:DNA-nicking Smr family endonuclease
MARRRTLRPDEKELWQAVARTTQAMHPTRPVREKQDEPPAHLPDPAPRPKKPQPWLSDFRVGEKSAHTPRHDLAPTVSERLIAAPVRMDRKNFDRMSRGKLAPEARIDLHGMTLAEAHPELIRFILNAHSDGLRLVLVITGKGKRGVDTGPIPQRQGVLKQQVPHWLHMPPLGPAILQVAEAHLKHGGTGAYYVYLRRHR